MDHVLNADRRTILKTAASCLVLGFFAPVRGAGALAATATPSFAPNAFVCIGSDDSVTVISKYLEMGQGIETGVAMALAEELDADWSAVRTETAPADEKLYTNMGNSTGQFTGASISTLGSYRQLREAGAAARTLLVRAASMDWRVPEAEIDVARGVISHRPSGRSAGFGTFVATARQLPPPAKVTLKSPEKFGIIGKPLSRLDALAKTTGKQKYTGDIRLPGMVHAVIRRPTRVGAVVRSIDDAAALAVPGVRWVKRVSSGVAVVADTHWAAIQGRDALKIDWDESQAERRSSGDLFEEFRTLTGKPGASAKNVGDIDGAMLSADKTVTAEFQLPYLAHAPMEPVNCVVRLGKTSCELWYGCQFQTGDQKLVAQALGMAASQITIHTLSAGGSFGRRGSFSADFVMEAVEIAKELPRDRPVLLQWTREDDISGGCYRPMSCHRMDAVLDRAGKAVGWRHRIAVQSIAKTMHHDGLIQNGIDPISVRNASDLPYEIANLQVELHSPECGVTVMPWRSVGASHNVFVVECFIDRIARAAGIDPIAYRRSLLPANSRFRPVMDAVARRAQWGQVAGPDAAQGFAMSTLAGSYIALVAEVKRVGAKLKVERVTVALDCGQAVNPNLLEAQIEGGILFGLSAALFSEITLADGIPQQSNFDTYQVLRIIDVPVIDIEVLPSAGPPTGVGETAVPAIAPAVANAVLALTGEPVSNLPMRDLFAS